MTLFTRYSFSLLIRSGPGTEQYIFLLETRDAYLRRQYDLEVSPDVGQIVDDSMRIRSTKASAGGHSVRGLKRVFSVRDVEKAGCVRHIEAGTTQECV